MTEKDTKGAGYLRSPVSDSRLLKSMEGCIQMIDSCIIRKRSEAEDLSLVLLEISHLSRSYSIPSIVLLPGLVLYSEYWSFQYLSSPGQANDYKSNASRKTLEIGICKLSLGICQHSLTISEHLSSTYGSIAPCTNL